MKKITFSLIVCFAAIIKLSAQLDSVSIAQRIMTEANKIEYVFEGTIIRVVQYAGDENGFRINKNKIIPDPNVIGRTGFYTYSPMPDGGPPLCYSIATIKICQMFKGNYTIDTIQLVSVNETNVYKIKINGLDTTIVYIQENDKKREIRFKKGMEGYKAVWFVHNHNIPAISNAIKLSSRIGGLGFNYYSHDSAYTGKVYAMPTGLLDYYKHQLLLNRTEMLNYLKDLPLLNLNINLPNWCEPANIPNQKKNENINDTFGDYLKKAKIYEGNLKNYEAWQKSTALKLKNVKHKSSSKRTTPEELNLSMNRPRVTGAITSPWLEFDIFVSSNVNYTYFDNCAIWIKYDNSLFNRAFGSNIAPANIQIIRAPAFNTATYIDPQLNVTNQTNSKIAFGFGRNVIPSLNRVNITTTPQKMLTIRMLIQNIDRAAGIEFSDTAISSNVSLFTLSNMNGANLFAYNKPTNYIGTNNDKTCMPIIESFTDNVHAGTGEIMTIVGKYFGDNDATSVRSVVYKNANKGDLYPYINLARYGIDNYDIVYWHHDTIKIKIPSVTDSITLNERDIDYQAVPGSGKFRVYNKYDKFGESSTSLTIPYAVIQYIDQDGPTYQKSYPKLAGINAKKGYTLYMTSAFDNAYPEAKAVIKKAMRDWTCKTGINWTLGSNTSLGIESGDNTCVLDINPDLGLAALTQTSINFCDSVGILKYYMQSFDIIVSSAFVWEFDTLGNVKRDELDFYQVITHELGHGHLLEHFNHKDEILYFENSIKGINFNDRKTLATSPNAIDGGNYVTTYLVDKTACSNAHKLVICNNSSSVQNIQAGKSYVTIFPNPINNGFLTIVPNKPYTENTVFIVSDIMGKEIINLEITPLNENEYKIPVDNLTNGIYLLNIKSGNTYQTAKFIKLQ